MFIGYRALESCFNYLRVGEGFFAEVSLIQKVLVVEQLLTVMRRQINFESPAIDQTTDRDELFGHLTSTG
jgi:hypothetical protein